MNSTLAARAVDVNAANKALGAETSTAPGATFVRDLAYPSIWDTNHVAAISVRSPADIDGLFAAADRAFAHCAHRQFVTDFRTPPEFIARLLLEGGYERDSALCLVLEGDLIGDPPARDIRPIDSGAAWDDYRPLHLANWLEHQERLHQPPLEHVADSLFESHRRRVPPVRYYLAYVNNEPVGYFNSWEGLDGMGQVEDLFVDPAYRKRGIATALIHHCVADARAHGAGPVTIFADPDDTPKHIYARMGFRPVATTTAYLKKLS